jgi:hypothetical protein
METQSQATVDPRDRPGVWFSLLCESLSKQDFAQAAQAKRELTRLGVDVIFRQLPDVIFRQLPPAKKAVETAEAAHAE